MEKLVKSFYGKNERGAVLIIIVVSMVAFIGLTALAIDIGYALVTRNELQNVADSAALAAARVIGHTYETMPFAQQQIYVANPSTIIPIAQQVAAANTAGGKSISINDSDVIIGKWDGKTLTPTLLQPNAVKVTARRDASANGPITTFFAVIFGIKTINLTTFATAALTAQSTAPAGQLGLPAAIDATWFTTHGCDQPIQFYPTASCAGWDTFNASPANAATLKSLVDGLANRSIIPPPATANVTQFDFIGGNVASAFPDLQNLFNVMRLKNDNIVDFDSVDATWTAVVPVYSLDCSNPAGPVTIVGFTLATITSVTPMPAGTINATVLCNFTVPGGRGGGAYFGNFGSIPGLVQ